MKSDLELLQDFAIPLLTAIHKLKQHRENPYRSVELVRSEKMDFLYDVEIRVCLIPKRTLQDAVFGVDHNLSKEK